ncbi:hypothetical protein GHT06_004665 [Daphnia sinensis]|uniref:Fibronectin type-III domain-containing protein n=1 Tax=Daphnia sinensis TaxID=1820382 RepID=A0AAD5KUX0_9CRUS|nr:hypothetical protein GHT06_004665 [Daphnia sinensis]
MSRDLDVIKIFALGRPFAIGMLYNYIDDTTIPNLRIWDPDVVSRLAVVDETLKSTAKVHLKVLDQIDEDDVDGEKEQTLLTDLGMDDHTAVSVTAGLLRSSLKGAWQYAADWIDQTEELNDGVQVAVHCRSTTKKVSVTPKKQLEIICLPKRLVDSQATHVVLAITYGREAFCIFPQKQAESQKNEQNDYETIMEKTRNYAYFFQNRLMNDCETLESDRDEEGDEEDGRCRPIPKDYQCLVYSDAMAVKGGKNWTLNPVAEQYEACRKIMKTEKSIMKGAGRKSEHTEKAIPLKVWLYPLHKLIPATCGKIPTDFLDVSRNSMFRCHLVLGRFQRIRSEVEVLIHQLDRLAVRQCIPLTISKRIQEFKELTIAFVSVFIDTFAAWTLSIRRGTAKEEKLAEVIDALKTRSPFDTKKLHRWLDLHGKEITTLERLAHLPSVLFTPDLERLVEELRTGGDGSVAVVLYLPSLTENSGDLIDEMSHFIDVFKESPLLYSMTWPEEISGQISQSATLTHRQLFAAGQEFSDWVRDNNRDAVSIRYIIFYDERASKNSGRTLPFTRLYQCGKVPTSLMDFTIPKAPEEVTVVKNRRGVIALSWPADHTIGLTNYLVQYCKMDGGKQHWESVRNYSNTVVIDYLQSGETYLFRVAAETLGGRSPFSPVSCKVTIDPVCPPPTGLRAHGATDTSISISWYHQPYTDNGDEDSDNFGNEEVSITSFSVECWMVDGRHESTFIQRSTTNKSIVLEPLVPNTEYYVQVSVECRDAGGSTFYSPASDTLKTKTLREAERAAHIVRRSSKKCSVSLGIDVFELPLKERSNAKIQGVGHYVFGEPSYLALAGERRQRTILVLGATGSGKSTLINAMANYILGIEWEDDFRFKLINEPTDKAQAYSQTDSVTTYDFFEMKGSRLDYSLTIVDTPGFGDTRGIKEDKKIMQQIHDYFKCRHGIQQLEAVCFVVQSSLSRLTPTQHYIFDSILSIFGQDIKDNIRLMVTFADNDLPTILDAVKAVGIPLPEDPITGLITHHKFNSSVFFASNQDENQTNDVNQTYFEIAVESFDKFFADLRNMKPKSLTLTREVLEERRRLEALVEDLQLRTQIKLARIDESEKVKKMLQENQQQMDENKNFDFEVELLVPKSTDISGTGQFTTNCKTCTATCHFPCSQANDTDKHRCSVMDPNGNCRICMCPWNVHFNQKFRYEMVKEKVQRSSDAMRKQYQGAKAEALTNQELLEKIQAEIDRYEKQLMELVQETSSCIQRLNEIALKPHTLSTPAYIDLMIQTEKQGHRPGYQQRITTLQRLRQVAEMMNKLVNDHQIPKIQSTSQSMFNNCRATSFFFKSLKR